MKAKISLFVWVIAISNILFACKKEETETGQSPEIKTVTVTLVTHYTSLSGGEITSEGSSEIISKGLCWSDISQTPDISDDKVISSGTGQAFSDYAKCLKSNTTYYIRAYATNKSGTGYGDVLTFTTLSGLDGTTSDIEGNIYKTVEIGFQTWLAQSLRTTKYNNGESISTNSGDIELENSPKYQWSANNDLNNISTYGRLYTWYTATDSRNVCPCGWHVPDNDEWAEMIDYLGGDEVAGGKLKETGTSHWQLNVGATNSSGFTALPSGMRDYNSNFVWFGANATFWSSSDNGDVDSFYYEIESGETTILNYTYNKGAGYSIRCIKD